MIPRGAAGGLTFFTPSEERLESGLYSRSYLENQMAVALGGRVAEEIIFGKEFVTTGASNDFQQVSRVARSMIVNYGFSDKVGQVSMSSQGGNPFLGQSAGQSADYSAYTADIIDGEVKALVEKAYTRAMDLCMTHIDVLHKTADALIEKESLDGDEFARFFEDSDAQLYLQ